MVDEADATESVTKQATEPQERRSFFKRVFPVVLGLEGVAFIGVGLH